MSRLFPPKDNNIEAEMKEEKVKRQASVSIGLVRVIGNAECILITTPIQFRFNSKAKIVTKSFCSLRNSSVCSPTHIAHIDLL
eukprot:COSAG05_NODE_153_length_15894_cov_27.910415_10_plen_83_part_00